MQRKDTKSFGVVTSGPGSSSCTIFRDGTKITSANGKITRTNPDGTKSEYDGNSYAASRDENNEVTLRVKK